MRLIFTNPNLSLGIHCSKSGDWEYSEEHKCYIWQGRELTPEEFNEVCVRVFEDARHAWPHGFIHVRAVGKPSSEINVDLNPQLVKEKEIWKERAVEMRNIAEQTMAENERLRTHLASMTMPLIAKKDPKLAAQERAAFARSKKSAVTS